MEPGQGAQIAAQSLFTAASAANAIPVAGQFVSAGLAIAGLFAKIFGGRRRRKKAEAARKEWERKEKNINMQKAGQADNAPGGVGGAGQQNPGQPMGVTAPATEPVTSSFNTWGGGQAPTVQPVQQVLNSRLGIRQ